MVVVVLRVIARDGVGWLSRAPSGNAVPNEPGRNGDVDDASDPGHTVCSSLSRSNRFATVPELRMGGAMLDRFGLTSAVKSADRHPKSRGVSTAT